MNKNILRTSSILFSTLFLVNSAPEDYVAEYYQQQVEMLEGFNEMDALADRGYVPGMSKVDVVLYFYAFLMIKTFFAAQNQNMAMVVAGRT